MTHFADPERLPDLVALCGAPGMSSIIWRNDARADCVPCQDAWAARTGWAHPLPELVA